MLYRFTFTTLFFNVFAAFAIYNAPLYGQVKSSVKQPVLKSITGLKYINTFELPHKQLFQNTTIGGLSGIDYDPLTETYYLICDDISKINPTRFYQAKINISDEGIDNVSFLSVHTLLQQDGRPYAKMEDLNSRPADAEAIRYNGTNGSLIWTSEGVRVLHRDNSLLIDPTIKLSSTAGEYIDSIPLPQNLRMNKAEFGPRNNAVLEGVTFANHFKSLFVSLEEPLFQDGPRAGLEKNNAFVRIYQFNLKNKRNIAQFAYELEPVAHPAGREGVDLNNGISEILWLGTDQFLVVERSFSGGPITNVKVFLASTKRADNIKKIKSLIKTPAVNRMSKRLLLDMDKLGIYIDNIEGVTFGPTLANGHNSLIFVADDNFASYEKTQFILFEIIP